MNVIASGLFGSVSGSSAATCATVAKIALPELKKRGYDENLSIGSLAGAGTLGILIPPSIMMVVYAVAAEVSIIQVFLAGFLPGLLVMVLYSGYIALHSLANPKKAPRPEPRMNFGAKLKELANLLPVLLLIALVFLVLISGWASATECAAWGVAGSLVIAAWQRSLTWQLVSPERNGRDPAHVYDHAHSRGRMVPVESDGTDAEFRTRSAAGSAASASARLR